MANPLPVPQAPEPKLNRTQARFWAVLQDPTNRNLTLPELARKAGYKTWSVWYYALEDQGFRTMVEALGVPVERRTRCDQVALAADPDALWQQDIVDVRRLVFDYPRHVPAADFRLDFSFIRNPRLKALVKRYLRAQVSFWAPRSLERNLTRMKPFLVSLTERYPDLESFATLTREMIEPLLTQPSWKHRGQTRPVTPHARRFMAIAVGGMFTYMQRHGWVGAPQRQLIFSEDKPRLPRKHPRPIPESVMEQLRTNLYLLPPATRNLVEILAAVGLRAGDALHLTEDCLEYDAVGDPRLKWYNHKQKREGRPLPVRTSVVEAIQRQTELVRAVPDVLGKRYLFRTPRGILQFPTLCNQLNTLAKKVPICSPDGTVFRFRPHQFRHTVGTEMINNGMGIADVMAYLGHQSPEMTLRYAEIRDETLKEKFKQVVLSSRVAGGAALAALQEQLAKGDDSELDWIVSNLRRLSLPFGYCLHHHKSPACPHANACFMAGSGSPCPKLVTTPEFLPVLRQTLVQIEDNIRAGNENGWEMYVSNQENQAYGLRHVIRDLELPDAERPRNRGGRKA